MNEIEQLRQLITEEISNHDFCSSGSTKLLMVPSFEKKFSV